MPIARFMVPKWSVIRWHTLMALVNDIRMCYEIDGHGAPLMLSGQTDTAAVMFAFAQ